MDMESARYSPKVVWVMKILHVYTMGFDLSVKKNQIMNFSGKRMELETMPNTQA